MNIELRGSPETWRKFLDEISTDHIFRDPGHPLANIIAEIEDQLEPDADRSMDFVDLDEIYQEDL